MPEGIVTTPAHAAHHPSLQHHFENMEQQREAGTLGMWVFLVTEIMFFGGMFLAYTLYRSQYPAAFVSASNHLDITLGAVNTGVLIVSSFTMAMAVWSTQVGRNRATIICLILTMILGATFLGIKAVEYKAKSGPAFQTESRPTRRHRQAQAALDRRRERSQRRAVLLDLFRHDRHARAAHDYRSGHHDRNFDRSVARQV